MIDRNLTAKLAHLASITNTISGGMSMHTFHKQKNEDHYLITVKAPGVDPSSLKVTIDTDKLLVHQILQMGSHGEIPYLLNFFMIPQEVNFSKITAEYADDELHIALPFNELADGFYKEINILK